MDEKYEYINCGENLKLLRHELRGSGEKQILWRKGRLRGGEKGQRKRINTSPCPNTINQIRYTLTAENQASTEFYIKKSLPVYTIRQFLDYQGINKWPGTGHKKMT